MQKLLVDNFSDEKEVRCSFNDYVKKIKSLKTMLSVLKAVVAQEKVYEEESMLYKKPKAAKHVWPCMEFFYQNLWNKNFPVWSDKKEKWENYNILISYNGKVSVVSIIYGIGSSCVIAPLDKVPKGKPILELERIKVLNNMNIVYEED